MDLKINVADQSEKGGSSLGVYLDSKTGYTLYQNELEKPYFVDKTRFLEELIPMICEGSNYICVTRPRRFGKTVMANRIAAFFRGAVMRKICSTDLLFRLSKTISSIEINLQSSTFLLMTLLQNVCRMILILRESKRN